MIVLSKFSMTNLKYQKSMEKLGKKSYNKIYEKRKNMQKEHMSFSSPRFSTIVHSMYMIINFYEHEAIE